MAVAAVCLLLRAAAAGLEGRAGEAPFPEELGGFILTRELPGAKSELPDTHLTALWAELPGFAGTGAQSPSRSPDPAPGEEPPGEELPGPTGPNEGTDAPGPDPTEPAGTADPADPTGPGVPEEPEQNAIGTTITGSGSNYTGVEGIYIKNETGYQIDVDAALSAPMPFEAGAAVLIVHTHGSEAYNPTPEDDYVPSDHSRTEDLNYNMIRVGDELAKVLEARGVTVYHDRSIYDYPSYSGSYDRSLAGAEAYVAEHPEIKVIIDLHRDALEGNGVIYKTVADVGDAPCAQVMIICGTDAAGIQPEPDWHINLGFAVKLQAHMTGKYPTLARPLKISQYRYNQNLAPGGLLVEVGTNGNTLKEAITAAQYFGECLADMVVGENGT